MKKRYLLSVMALASTVLLGCGESGGDTNAGSNDTPANSQDVVMDTNPSIISSCAYDSVTSVSISTLSYADTAAICKKMATRIGSNPSIQSLRMLSKAVSDMHIQDNQVDVVGTAYQYMRVVESRGQLNDDAAMMKTFDVIFKIYNGTEGRVTPKDLNILLSNMGNGATKLSDDGLINLAALLSVKKQDAGQ